MEKVNQRGKYLFIAGIISLIIAIVILFVIPDPSANNVEIAKKATSAVNRPLNVRPKTLTLRRSVFLWQNIALHLN